MQKRIWELDVLRGLLILGMVIVHLIYDLQNFFGSSIFAENLLYHTVLDWGGVFFFLLSGICATLGHRPFYRGLVVLGCATAVSVTTYGLYALQLAGKDMIIYFGVLHCLGSCMILWPLFRRIPWPVTALVSVTMVIIGILIDPIRFGHAMWLLPFGFKPVGFVSPDYFGLLPFLGFFLLGTLVGKFLYANKTTLFPNINSEKLWISFFTFLGKWSLLIYLLHQPVIIGVVSLLEVVL